MKNYFSLRRFGLMFKADWIEYKLSVSLFFASVFAITSFLFVNMKEELQAILFIVGLISILLCFYIYVGGKFHRTKNRFLTLPASAFEKFTEMLFVGFLLLCVYLLIYFGILGISHHISGAPIWFSSLSDTPRSDNALGNWVVAFICTFLLMCFIMFRKFPLQTGIVLLMMYAGVFSYTAYLIIKFEDFQLSIPQDGFIQSSALLRTLGFLSTYNGWGMGIASVVLLYISFLKLKEKQIR